MLSSRSACVGRGRQDMSWLRFLRDLAGKLITRWVTTQNPRWLLGKWEALCALANNGRLKIMRFWWWLPIDYFWPSRSEFFPAAFPQHSVHLRNKNVFALSVNNVFCHFRSIFPCACNHSGWRIHLLLLDWENDKFAKDHFVQSDIRSGLNSGQRLQNWNSAGNKAFTMQTSNWSLWHLAEEMQFRALHTDGSSCFMWWSAHSINYHRLSLMFALPSWWSWTSLCFLYQRNQVDQHLTHFEHDEQRNLPVVAPEAKNKGETAEKKCSGIWSSKIASNILHHSWSQRQTLWTEVKYPQYFQRRERVRCLKFH